MIDEFEDVIDDVKSALNLILRFDFESRTLIQSLIRVCIVHVKVFNCKIDCFLASCNDTVGTGLEFHIKPRINLKIRPYTERKY